MRNDGDSGGGIGPLQVERLVSRNPRTARHRFHNHSYFASWNGEELEAELQVSDAKVAEFSANLGIHQKFPKMFDRYSCVERLDCHPLGATPGLCQLNSGEFER